MLDDATTISLQRIKRFQIVACSPLMLNMTIVTHLIDTTSFVNAKCCPTKCALHERHNVTKTFYNEVSLSVEEDSVLFSVCAFSYFGIPDIFVQFLSCVRCHNSDDNVKTHVHVCALNFVFVVVVIVISTFGMSNLIFPYRVSSSTFSFRDHDEPVSYFTVAISISFTQFEEYFRCGSTK